MSSSREQSPDWLHSFQVPRHSAPTVSSDLELFPSDNSSQDDNADCDKLPISEILRLSNKDRIRDAAVDGSAAEFSKKFSKAKSPPELSGKGDTPSKNNSKIQKRKGGDKTVAKAPFQGSADKEVRNFSAYTISSDSESCRITDTKNEDSTYLEETSDCKASQSQNGVKGEDGCFPDTGRDSPLKKIYRRKYLKQAAEIEDIEQKTDTEEMKVSGDPMDIAEEERERHQKPHASSSRLPLVLSEKVHRTKALVECEGDSIDLSGDMGAVGRVVISDTPSGNHEMYLDLKGTLYKTTILPCRTFCVVSFGQSEAKIEAIMSDYMQLSPQSDFNEAETVVEGTLEGFSLDLDDDADGIPKSFPDQNGENGGNGEKTNVKKKKKADRTPGLSEKRGRKAGSKPDAKVSKKTRVSKKPTMKK